MKYVSIAAAFLVLGLYIGHLSHPTIARAENGLRSARITEVNMDPKTGLSDTFNGTPPSLSCIPYSGAQPRCFVLVDGK
jgi:hypothetical protein